MKLGMVPKHQWELEAPTVDGGRSSKRRELLEPSLVVLRDSMGLLI